MVQARVTNIVTIGTNLNIDKSRGCLLKMQTQRQMCQGCQIPKKLL